MATVDDPRIGIFKANGAVERWPQTDVIGGMYTRPATTQGIGEHHFIVLPMQPVDETIMDEIEAKVLAAETPVNPTALEIMDTAVEAPAEAQPATPEADSRSSRRLRSDS